MSTVPIPNVGIGANLDALPAELDPGVWSNVTNFRFRNGFAEKWNGINNGCNATVTPYWAISYGVSSTRYAVYSGLTKAYAFDHTASTETEITRYKIEQAISSITRISGVLAEATTAVAHGLSTGDKVSVFDAVEAGYNVTAAAITVMSATVFRYAVTSIAANATVVGSYIVDTATVTSNFTGAIDDRITGGVVNGTLFVNYPTDGLFYWAGDASVKMRKLPFASFKADVGRPFGTYFIQLAPTMGGVKQPYRVVWSGSIEPGALPASFTANNLNDAGLQDLAQTNGKLVDCLPLGDINIIYTEDGRWAQRYIGGNDVFSFNPLPGADGLLARSCVVNTPKGHVFLTQNLDVKIHQGGWADSIAEGWVRAYIQANINSVFEYKKRAFLAMCPGANEVWICLPSFLNGSATSCEIILAWNWKDNTWSKFDVTGTGLTYGTNGLWPKGINGQDVRDYTILAAPTVPCVAFSTGEKDSGGNLFGSAITGTLERIGMHFGTRDIYKYLQRSRWNFDSVAGRTASIYHGSSTTSDGSVTYTSPVTYTVGTTNYVNARATGGRYLAMKLTTTAFPLSVRSVDLDFTSGGVR